MLRIASFCPTSSPKPKDSSLSIINEKLKRQTLTDGAETSLTQVIVVVVPQLPRVVQEREVQ